MLIDWGSFQHLLDFTQHLVRTSLGLTWEALSMAYQTTPSKGVPVKAWPCPHCGLQDLPSSLATPAVPLSSLSGSPPQWAASVSLTSFSSLMSSIHTRILGNPPGHDMLEEPFLNFPTSHCGGEKIRSWQGTDLPILVSCWRARIQIKDHSLSTRPRESHFTSQTTYPLAQIHT